MKVALYARVSTVDKDQNPEVQLTQLRDYCRRMGWEIHQEYVDRASAIDYLHRVAWAQMMKEAAARRFDILLVFKMSRAFRSSIHAHNSLEMLQRYKVNFCSYSEQIDFSTSVGKFYFAILAATAEMEREGIAENVTAGMAYAKEHGTRSGLPVGRPRSPLDFTNVCKAFVSAKGNYSEAARILSGDKRKKLTPGFVFNRIKRQAEERGYSMKDLLKEILDDSGKN